MFRSLRAGVVIYAKTILKKRTYKADLAGRLTRGVTLVSPMMVDEVQDPNPVTHSKGTKAIFIDPRHWQRSLSSSRGTHLASDRDNSTESWYKRAEQKGYPAWYVCPRLSWML